MEEKFLSFDLGKCSAREAYRLMISSIVPRPIAFVSTISNAKVGNLAPFSFFMGVCSNPPCLAFSISSKPDGQKKDTLKNIEENGQFVVNSANEWNLDAVVQSASEFSFGIDEREIVGLTALPSVAIKAVRIKEAAVQMECKLHSLLPIGDGSAGSATLVIGQILHVHVNEQCYHEGKIDPQKLKPLARLGGTLYSTLGTLIHRETPKP